MNSIFGTDGIRGKFNKEITISLAHNVGYALGLIIKNDGPILLGRDTRVSGETLLKAIGIGINKSGKEFINMGVCPTPAIPFLIKQKNFSGGIMISASHNPPEFNGIKIFDNNGKKITKEIENKIQAILSSTNENKFFENKDTTIKTDGNLLNIYIQSLIKSMGNKNLRGMKIVLDACYGSATTCAEEVFSHLGASVKTINNNKDGTKINLNCGSTYLEPIKKAIIENNADMGFSFDGDADRVIGIDSEGNILDGDHILFLWGRELLEQKVLTNNLLISTEMANLGFENAWNEIGGILHRTKVGDKFIYEAINQNNALLGGEQSGHILSYINNFSGDGILTAIQISKLCKEKEISLQKWLQSSFYPFPQKLTNIKLDFDIKKINKNTQDIFHELIQNYSQIKSKNCRIFIRPSGTEPLLRILVEAENKEKVTNLSKEITLKLSNEMKKISKTSKSSFDVN